MTCWLVAGAMYGDEGKGATTDYIVHKTGANLIVRYNGGAQCAHNVVAPDGTHHTFRQFGSSFLPDVKTYLSRFVLINPVAMLIEGGELKEKGIDVFPRTYVDPNAPIITPFHIALNHLKELARGDKKHGSTGSGIGTTRKLHLEHGDKVLLAKDLSSRSITEEKLRYIKNLCSLEIPSIEHVAKDPDVRSELKRIMEGAVPIPWYLDKYEEWSKKVILVESALYFKSFNTGIVFEGAQGILIDEVWGFQPHVTWTDITFNNTREILKDMEYEGDIHKIGVLRSYATRHGAGPFPSEDSFLKEILENREKHNKTEAYAGNFRIGNLDLPLLIYALHAIGEVDSLAINHMDVAKDLGTIEVRLSKMDTVQVKHNHLISMLTAITRTPISIVGYGPTHNDRIFHGEL